MTYLIVLFILLYSIILHELAHAKVAEIMGDPTARLAGRITLNPIPHLDLFGTVLPLLLFLSGAPIIFGWAKPVPINPYNFHDQRRGILFVSAAGIVANLFVAWVLATILKFLPYSYLNEALQFGVRINVVLAIFNLIPIPPLDGSKLFETLLPYPYSEYIYRMEPYGFFILLFILIFPPTQMLLWFVIDFVYNLLMVRLF